MRPEVVHLPVEVLAALRETAGALGCSPDLVAAAALACWSQLPPGVRKALVRESLERGCRLDDLDPVETAQVGHEPAPASHG